MSPTIDDAHWHTLTIEEQFANIGSEVSRSLNALTSQNESRKNGAISRMIDLFSASKRDT